MWRHQKKTALCSIHLQDSKVRINLNMVIRVSAALSFFTLHFRYFFEFPYSQTYHLSKSLSSLTCVSLKKKILNILRSLAYNAFSSIRFLCFFTLARKFVSQWFDSKLTSKMTLEKSFYTKQQLVNQASQISKF